MFTEKRGKGYVGKSMSVNAADAYTECSMPLSQWTKKTLVAEITFTRDDLNEKLLNKMTVKQLRDEFLTLDGWHHTGALYNKTNFYAINADRLADFTNEKAERLIAERKQYLEDTKEERAKARAIEEEKRQQRRAEQEEKANLEILFKYTKYKNFKAFSKAVKNGKIDLDEVEELHQKCLAERKAELTRQWANDAEKLAWLENVENLESRTKSPFKK